MLNLHNRSSYTCYGFCAEVESRPSTLGFTGHWLDAGRRWYHLGNGYRAYNPKLMRFHTTDNLSPFSYGGINTYSYCSADPINNVDPSGHQPWRWPFSRRPAEPKYPLTVIKRTDAHELTKAYSGWHYHPEANGWDAEMAIKLPKRVQKKNYYGQQIQLANNAQSDVPKAYAVRKLNSVTKKIEQSRDRLDWLKRGLPAHAGAVADSMAGRPLELPPPYSEGGRRPYPPQYSEIGGHSVVLQEAGPAMANQLIRETLSEHDTPPL